MKKSEGFISITTTVLSSTLSMAASETADAVAEGTRSFFSGLGTGIVTLFTNSSLIGNNEILTRILMWVLLFAVIYSAIDLIFKGNKLQSNIISAIIVTLAMISLPDSFLSAIRASYGALGATLLSVIPFLILLVFTTRVKSLLAARMVWIFFVVYYFALLIYTVVTKQTSFISGDTLPYFAAFLAGIIIMFGIGSIRRAIFRGKMGDLQESGKQIGKKAKLLHNLQDDELRNSYGSDRSSN